MAAFVNIYETFHKVFTQTKEYLELFSILLLPFSMLIMYYVLFAIFKTPLNIYKILIYLLALFFTFLIFLANLIHPTKRVLGGIGIIIAFIGLVIDAYQAVNP
ncbi:MAG: Unknown protein [uncultured Sulfurovum sp.]|uniref:Uncharacterized protein n=1 Tax=uncultured Sulfurovum sp. TaxID=269237 RepID=A0A6S6TRT5_9BACT|nr:MAG: Unknown protein [uncultured Sulfurovum sp.]